MDLKNKINKISLFISIIILFVAGFLSLTTVVYVNASETELIETRSDFISAVAKAKEGDTILVGDINFSLEGTGAVNDASRITINKGITVKSGKANGEKSTFLGGSVILQGKEIAGEKRTFTFENIIFDGNIAQEQIKADDWALSYDSQNNPISPSPLKSNYAISFGGGAIDASFIGCKFANYMAQYGGAIQAYYNGVPFRLYGAFTDCLFEDNTAQYYGGAMYLEGSVDAKNVQVDLNNCTFKNNVCGLNSTSWGGGAIYVGNCILNLKGSSFVQNSSNFRFINHQKINEDVTQGGALFLNNSTVSATLCTFVENKASLGGAIGTLGVVNLICDGCVFTENFALANDDNALLGDYDSDYGRMSGKSIGGAMYVQNYCIVTLTNTSVYNNFAQNVSGGIHIVYNQSSVSFATVNLEFCSIVNNICNTSVDEYKDGIWKDYTYPYDVFAIQGVTAKGCFVADDLFAQNVFNKSQKPSVENDYNYYATVEEAIADGVLLESIPQDATHLYAIKSDTANIAVPLDFVRQVFGESYSSYIGEFNIGSNCNQSVKIVLDTGDNSAVKIDCVYGEAIELPTVTKKWHAFDGWFTFDENQITSVNYLFAHNVDEFVVTANLPTYSLTKRLLAEARP